MCVLMLGLATALSTMALQSQTVAVSSASTTASTSVAVTLDVKDVALDRVLHMIARQAGLMLFFPGKGVPPSKHVTLQMRGVGVDDAFMQALTGTGLKATIVSNVALVADNETDGVATVSGIITGTVIDSTTRRPVRGATISLDDATKGVLSADDGSFRFVGVTAGTHVVRVKMIGYAKLSASVTVKDDERTTVTLVVSPRVNALDQVVVTGTVVATELKAIPNAITIITGKELQDRGVTHIDQLFHGDVPGLIVNRNGQAGASNPGYVSVAARGSTRLVHFGDGINNEGVKTYVDGVELADRNFLGLIDPTTIDRIEILTGPQASTIYGSNAINGVIQVFTKRGNSVRPEFTMGMRSQWTQNNVSSSLAPNHTADASVSGVEGHVSYNLGGSWVYQGSWTPAVLTQTKNGFGGARLSFGPLTTDLSVRADQGRNINNAIDGYAGVERGATGLGALLPGTGGTNAPSHKLVTNSDRSFTASGTYRLTSWWSHSVTVGTDQLDREESQTNLSYRNPTDSGFWLARPRVTRMTTAYNSSANIPLGSLVALVATAGMDESHNRVQNFYGSYVVAGDGAYFMSTYPHGGWQYSQSRNFEHGGFLQGQLGLANALFFTYGLRAVFNPNIGSDKNPNLEPRYGVAYSFDVGSVSAKLRASYGTATRPPDPHSKDPQYGSPNLITIWGTNITTLGNPNLLPESQRGGEGGLEVYWGNRASVQLTHYDQTVDDLILTLVADSVDILPSQRPLYPFCGPTQCWLEQQASLNLGSVRNQGWEGKGTWNMGPFAVNGTYTYMKSRIIGVRPKFHSQFPEYVVGGSFFNLPEHTYAMGLTYTNGATRIAYNLQGQGHSLSSPYRTKLGMIGTDYRLRVQLTPRAQLPSTYMEPYPGFFLGDINMTHQFSSHVEGTLQVSNVTNSYQGDVMPTTMQAGRMTGLGVRLRF